MPLARQIRRVVLPCLLLLAGSLPAMARDHLVDPGDPSARAGGPVWPSLGALVTQGEVAGGDRILLAPGRHGACGNGAATGRHACNVWPVLYVSPDPTPGVQETP